MFAEFRLLQSLAATHTWTSIYGGEITSMNGSSRGLQPVVSLHFLASAISPPVRTILESSWVSLAVPTSDFYCVTIPDPFNDSKILAFYCN